VRRYLRDPTFSRFDTIPECDRHTHTDTRPRHIPRLARRRAVKIKTFIQSNIVGDDDALQVDVPEHQPLRVPVHSCGQKHYDLVLAVLVSQHQDKS